MLTSDRGREEFRTANATGAGAVARVTIRQGIELLRKGGLLDARQGRGALVSGRSKKHRWLNLVTDFNSLINSIRNNVLKRIQIDENAGPPTPGGGEGKPARSYAFLRGVQYNSGEPFSVVNLDLDRRIYDRGAQRTFNSCLPPFRDIPPPSAKGPSLGGG